MDYSFQCINHWQRINSYASTVITKNGLLHMTSKSITINGLILLLVHQFIKLDYFLCQYISNWQWIATYTRSCTSVVRAVCKVRMQVPAFKTCCQFVVSMAYYPIASHLLLIPKISYKRNTKLLHLFMINSLTLQARGKCDTNYYLSYMYMHKSTYISTHQWARNQCLMREILIGCLLFCI